MSRIDASVGCIDYNRALRFAEGCSLIPAEGLWTLFQFARACSGLRGSVVEFGVYRGGSAIILDHARGPNQPLHLFDGFRGLPKPCEHDAIGTPTTHRKGEFSGVAIEEVSALFECRPEVHIHEGMFDKAVESVIIEEIAFAHLDADLYESTRIALNWVVRRLVVGGLILLDDAGSSSCPGVRCAVGELCDDFGGWPVYLLPYGQCLLVNAWNHRDGSARPAGNTSSP